MSCINLMKDCLAYFAPHVVRPIHHLDTGTEDYTGKQQCTWATFGYTFAQQHTWTTTTYMDGALHG
jgi:hypothetical protein